MKDLLKEHWLGFILIAVLAVLIGFFMKWIFGSDPKIIAAAVAVISLLFQQWNLKKRDIAEAHRDKKVEVYLDFINILSGFLTKELDLPENEGDELSPEVQERFRKLSDGMIIWASPAVIKAWLKFKFNVLEEKSNKILLVDNVLQAMRKDLGNSNFALEAGDLVKLYLKAEPDTDFSEIFKNPQ